MKTPTPAKKPAKKYGPGEYKPDIEYKRIEDLPKAKVLKENRNEPHRPCPSCGNRARREHVYQRQLHDIGDLVSGRPIELEITYSQPHCQECNQYFMTALQAARQLTVKGITTDGSALYPAAIQAVWGNLPHQICEFHILKDLNQAILRAVATRRAATKIEAWTSIRIYDFGVFCANGRE